MRNAFLLLLALPGVFAASIEPVRNSQVAVSDVTLNPGASVPASTLPGVTVYFTDGEVDGRHVSRGDVIFQAAPSATTKNTGQSTLHFARVDFLTAGRHETWGTTGLSPHYKLLIENPYTRVYDIRIPAGTREPQHTHHDRVVICLSGATLKHLMPDGREEPSTLKSGEIAWRRGSTHIGQNLGKTDLWVIAVEPK